MAAFCSDILRCWHVLYRCNWKCINAARRMYGSRLRAYSIKLTKWMVRLLLPSTMLLPTCSDALALWSGKITLILWRPSFGIDFRVFLVVHRLDFENGNEALNWWRFRRDLGKFGRTCGLSLAWICTSCFLVLHAKWSMFGCLTYAPLFVKEGHELPKLLR